MNDTELLALLKAEKTPEELEALKYEAAVARLAGLLHTLICRQNHEKDCDYYIEEETTGQSTSKMEWIWRTKRLLVKASISAEELSLIIRRLPGLVSLAKEPYLLRFMNVLMPTLLTMFTASQAERLAVASSSQSDLADSAGFLEE